MAEREIVGSVDSPVEQGQLGPYELRLSEGSYVSDLGKIREAIRTNGPKATLGVVDLTDPFVETTVRLYLNFAYQSNSDGPPCSASIYVLALGNGKGTWHFSEPVAGLVLPGASFPHGGIIGSYTSLGFPNDLPLITKQNMAAAILTVFSYNNGNIDNSLKAGLARIIIATSEAIRMFPVQKGILNVIGDVDYKPDADAIHNWGGQTLGEGLIKDV